MNYIHKFKDVIAVKCSLTDEIIKNENVENLLRKYLMHNY